MIRLAVTAVALAFVASATATTPAPNVRGVLVGGITLICPSDEPCDPPLSVVAFSRTGAAPVVVRVGAKGVFATHLRAGLYAIRLAPPPQGGRVEPSTVRVPRLGVVRLRLAVR